MLPTRKYPAKVILFGEYTVLLGGDILAVPYEEFASFWELKENKDQRLIDFIEALIEYDLVELDYKLLLQLSELLHHGWQLTSSIKIGAGLGSSGSVVAAVYDVVGNTTLAPKDLRVLFQTMESYFHGQSSGIDPLVSYLNTTIAIQSGQMEAYDRLVLPSFRLYDSNIDRNTQTLVSWFKDKLKIDEEFSLRVGELTRLNNGAIAAILDGQPADIESISEFQFDHLQKLIPEAVLVKWNSKNDITWKICGAGGGGYFLQFELS